MQIRIWWPILFVATIVAACVLIFPSELRLADLLGRAGNYDEAVQTYQQLLENDPLRNDIRIRLTKLYLVNGAYEDAAAEVEKAGVENITDVFILNQIADVYSQVGDRQNTVVTLERVVDLQPEFRHRKKLAEAYEWDAQQDKAIAIYDELLAENPHDAKLLNKLVHLNLFQKNFPRVKNYLVRLLEVQPDNREARKLLGDVYIETGEKAFAAVEYERILKDEPDNHALREKLADLYVWIKNYDRAIPHYEHLYMQNVLNEAYFNELVAATEFRDPGRAIKYFQLRLKYLPHDAELRERLAELYLHLGYTDEAAEELRTLVRQHPDQPAYLENLAYLYQDTYRPELARQTLEDMVHMGFLSNDVFDELSIYYMDEKDYDGLLELYAELSQRDLMDAAHRSQYANILARTNKYAPAIAQYEGVLARNPRDADTRKQLANLYALTGKPKKGMHLVKIGMERYHQSDKSYLVFAAEYLNQQANYAGSILAYETLADLEAANFAYRRALIPLYIKTKDLGKAAQQYEWLMHAHPADLDLKFEYASLFWLKGDFDEMHEVVRGIEAERGSEPGIRQRVALFYFDRSFYLEAIQHLQQSLAATPGDSLSMQMLGLAYAWNNQPAEAKAAIAEYQKLYPNDYFTRYHMGVLLVGENRRDDALEEFQTTLALLSRQQPTSKTRMVRAKIYAYQGRKEEAILLFDELVAASPGDLEIQVDYAEGLLTLRDYRACDLMLNEVLQSDPNHYRALRLLGQSYFEQDKHQLAAQTLNRLFVRYPADLSLGVDLSDIQLAAGDWVGSTGTLKSLLDQQPSYHPARRRLIQLRREQNEAFALDYEYHEESDNFIRQAARFVFTKAASSLAAFRVLIGEEKFSTVDGTRPEESFTNIGLGILSSFGSKLKTFIFGQAREDDEWEAAGHASLRWNLNPRNSIVVSSDLNAIWFDPLQAAFLDGRLNRVQADVNLALFQRVLLWSELSYESHSIDKNEQFGKALRTYAQIGYRWRFAPALLTYYQFYHLNYDYKDAGRRSLLNIAENETIHYFGAAINDQLTDRLYYELSVSAGLNTRTDRAQYFGRAHLEYTLRRNLRLRSTFMYGKQNTLVGNDDNKTLALDFYYFY